MKRVHRLVWVCGSLLLLAGLGACGSSSNSNFVHIEVGATETQAAQTASAASFPTATAGPSPTPTATLVPFVIPTLDPAVDPDRVITRVGEVDITLAEFQQYVRFERFYRIDQIVGLAERRGVERILDLTRPENARIAATFTTLADSEGFGEQVRRLMIIDAIVNQEALRRGLELDPFQFDSMLAQYLTLQVGDGGELPPEFETRYTDFITRMDVFSGMSEEAFRRLVRARTYYAQLEFIISNQPSALIAAEQAPGGIEVQDIVVESEAAADQVRARLVTGESMASIATSLGFISQANSEWRIVSVSDQVLPDVVLDALLSAEPGQIVGPLATVSGWYVALVGEPVVTVLDPAEITALKRRYFLDWVESLMDDPAYVIDYNNWRAYIPQEPLPRDVSPLLRDENVILPAE